MLRSVKLWKDELGSVSVSFGRYGEVKLGQVSRGDLWYGMYWQLRRGESC